MLAARLTGLGRSIAHGALDPGPTSFVTAWPLEPLLWIALIAAAVAYIRLFARVPGYPSVRRAHFLMGIGAIAVALVTPVAVYADSYFWVHMVQHLLLTMVAAPLIALSAPATLALRASSPAVRQKLGRALHSRALQVLTHPLVTWGAFAAVMWASHFSPVYDLALRNEAVHVLEHLVYLAAGFLFWWPIVGLDPTSRPLRWPARIGYLVLAMPQQSFLGLAIYSSGRVLYPHYAELHPPLEALADQRTAGIMMWVGGDLLFIVALAFAVGAWMRRDLKDAERIDRRLTGAR